VTVHHARPRHLCDCHDGRPTAGDIDPKGAAAVEILELWDFVQSSLDERKKGVKAERRKIA
jgi:hypothetical protein